MNTFLWCDLQRNGLHVFFCKRWVPFFEDKVGCHFYSDFAKIFGRFAQIFGDFARIFDKSKL